MSENNLDLTADQNNETSDAKLGLEIGKPYDPRPHEDNARRNIAYLLIGLLAFIVIAIFVLLCHGKIAVEDIKDFGIILTPIIALVSAATGFYYGTKSNN